MKDHLANNIFNILVQVIFIFIFLTIFFFTYVGQNEKESFKNQINLIIDDIANNVDISNIVSEKYKEPIFIVVNGSLDLAKKSYKKKSERIDNKIKIRNKKLIGDSLIWIFMAITFLIIISIIFYHTNLCIPFHMHLKDGLLGVFFIAITELLFLKMITDKYWSVDPIKIRQHIGDSIEKWNPKKN